MRPVWAEVDLGAVAHNVKEIRRITASPAKVMAIVKANAYGHGAPQVSQVALDNGAERLGVAILDEALQLRMEGFSVPILVMGYTPPEEADTVVRHGITQTVYTWEQALALSKAAQKLDREAFVHLKIDTGMGRIGFLPTEEAVQVMVKIASLPGVNVEGAFTHFATADIRDKSFAQRQLQLFHNVLNDLAARGVTIPIKHAANSAGIIDMPESHLDMVRPGISIYGIYPSQEVQKDRISLKPAMALKAKVSFVKEVAEGTTVSYGCTWRAAQKTRIASLPLGYADGYTRLLSNKGHALIHGTKVPVVGRVCMDQCMLDVGQVPQTKIGDEVVLFGRQGQQVLPVEEVAEQIGTIPYEVVCMVSYRVPRRYLPPRR